MRLVEAVQGNPMWLGGALGLLLGSLVGVFLPIRAPAPVRASPADWSLPSLASTRPYTEAAGASVRGAAFWGADTEAADRRRPQATWKLRAIVTRPTARIAVTSSGKNDTVWVRMGGTLPDGSVLVALDRDTAWTQRAGCRSPHALYPLPGDEGSDPCAQDANAQASPAPGAQAPGGTNQQKTNTQ